MATGDNKASAREIARQAGIKHYFSGVSPTDKLRIIKEKQIIVLLFILLPFISFAQGEVDYRVESFGSVGTGNYTPFWMTGNTYGIVPLNPNNGYVRGSLAWKQSLSKDFQLEAGVDLAGAAKHSSSFWAHQFYAGLSWGNVNLTIGAKERYNSILDKDLSMGDMTFSANARPIPEVSIGFPEYAKVPFTKGIMKFKGNFSAGKSLDKNYILRVKNPTTLYATDIMWHRKSLFLRWADPEEKFPWSFTFALDHAAQWGGWTSFSDFGQLPASFEDFVKIVLGKSGGENTMETDRINVLGNHLGTINAQLEYTAEDFRASLYKQHLFDDNSGLEYANWRDGIWGGTITFAHFPFLKKVVLESLNTTNQSGPMHFLDYNTDDGNHYRGGGNDDYYNHDYYIGGWSYYGRTLGNPLLTSPEYNGDGSLHFKNNRLKAIHLGLIGNITSEFSYRFLFTQMYAWGRMYVPFLERKNNFSSLLECNYESAKWQGWKIGIQLAFDSGNLYGDNLGCSVKVSKSGAFYKKTATFR
jgi:hypothetical protein